MIQTPLRHRTTCWVVRGAGARRAPRLPDAGRERIGLREVAGLLLLPDGPHEIYGSAPAGHHLAGVTDTTGQWVGLLADAEERTWVAMTDFHGFGHLFYHLHRTGSRQDVYLATTLDALVDRLRADGVGPGVNWPYALTTLASTHTLLRSHWSTETFVEGVFCLRPDELLVMTDEGVGALPRPMTTDPDGRSYDELLDAGVERATGLLASVAGHPWDELRLYASGGKDNRGVQALLQAAGLLGRVRLASADPLRWEDPAGRAVIWADLAVTDQLRRRLGLRWSVEPDYEDRMLSWDESVQLHQSYHAGASWAFPAARQLRWPTAPHVALRGGAGELLRSGHRSVTGSTRWRQTMGRKRDTLAADLDALYGMVVDPQVDLPGEVEAAGRALVARAFRPLPSAAVDEQLSSHYRLHRNRTHFGHLLSALDTRSLALFPLAVPEFLRAAYQLPFWQRHQGQFTFDLVERLDPRLNRAPFAGGSWPAPVWERRGLDVAPPEAPAGPWTRADFPDYFDTEDRNHARRGRWSGPHRFEIRTMSTSEAVTLLWRLHDVVDDRAVLPTGTVSSLADQAGLGRIHPGSTVVRVASLLRALDTPVAPDPDGTVEVLVRPRGWRGWRGARGRRTGGPEAAERPGQVRTPDLLASGHGLGGLVPFAADPSTPRGVFCHAWAEGTTVRARRVGDLADRADLVHSFALLRGATPVAEVDATGPEATLATDVGPGRYRVRLTARRADRPEVAYRALSQPVTVAGPDRP